MNPTLLLVLALAFILEGLVEYVLGSWWQPGTKKWRAQYIPAINIAMGMVMAFGYKVDMLALLGAPPNIMGQVLTGVAIGRGTQYLHTFFLNFLSRTSIGGGNTS